MSPGLVASHNRRADHPLRAPRPSPWLPPLVAAAAAIVGLVNIASTLTPSLPHRVRTLLEYEPARAVPIAHALVLPIGVSLLILAFYLGKRRRGAWMLTVIVLVLLGALNVIKGLDLEEAFLSWALVGLLVFRRGAFFVRQDRPALKAALWRIPMLVVGATVTALVAVWATSDSATPHVTWARAFHEAIALLTFSSGSLHSGTLHYHHAFRWMPWAIEMVSVLTLLSIFYLLLRPLAGPRSLPGTGARRHARQLVERHGSDTLSYFKLRRDKHYLFSTDGRAFLGYQIEGKMLLVSSDPVGPFDALPALVRELFEFAAARGLKVGVINASERMRELSKAAGLRSFYFGDEAILDVRAFSLQGRRIRKIRQSVSRLRKAGYSATVAQLGELEPDELAEIEGISERWKGKHKERGFSMAMDTVVGPHQLDTALVLARDFDGAIRGFIHLVPSFGRAAMSLSAMRRDYDTPNGLMEYLVVQAIELLREQGVEELSLNFAAFARLMHSPSSRRDRFLGRAFRLFNPFFQIESLYRFNAKFFPIWEPRYLLYQGRFGLLPMGIAALIVEGQIPRPRLRPGANGRAAQPHAEAA